MQSACCGELCRVVTGDGLELQGYFAAPRERSDCRTRKAKAGGSGCRTALVHVHGWNGNFYENRFLDHAAAVCRELGVAFVSFNNRGHDYVADLLRPARGDYLRLGGIYERFEDCVADIRAAIRFAQSRGFREIILQGHSHGAIKAAHYIVATRDRRVRGLVLLSPSDDLGFGRMHMGKSLDSGLALARRLVRAGKWRELMPAGYVEHPVSAGTFLDSFGPDSVAGMFNLSRTNRTEFPELGQIRAPVLVAVGTVGEAFVGDAQEFVAGVRSAMARCPSFTGTVMEGAPHNYLGYERELASVLKRWIGELIRGNL